MNLPPLPGLARFTPTQAQHRQLIAVVQAYGQQCREQALLDAMNATLPFGKTGAVIAAAIGALKNDNYS